MSSPNHTFAEGLGQLASIEVSDKSTENEKQLARALIRMLTVVRHETQETLDIVRSLQEK